MKSPSKKSLKPSSKPKLPSSENNSPIETVYYYLVNTAPQKSLAADFESIISYLGTYGDIGLTRQGNTALFSFPESQRQSSLKLALPDRIVVNCEKNDGLTINILKNVTQNLGYRIFNPLTSAFLVIDPNLLDLSATLLDPSYSNVFTRFNLVPLFQYRNSLVFFARDPSGERIFLVNRHLLEHLLQHPADSTGIHDFATPVAENLIQFVALFDRGVIPISFYETLHQPRKILNVSGFATDSLESDVFVAPIVFVLDPLLQTFTQSYDANSSTRRDRLAKGSSLTTYINKTLGHITGPSEFLAAKIAKDVAYDTVKPGLVIPRLNLSIFISQGT